MITTITSWSSLPLAGGEERQRGENMRRRLWRQQQRRWQKWIKWWPKNQFQIHSLPTPEQKRHRNLFRILPGNKAHLVAKFEAIFCRYFRWRDRPNIAWPNINQISPETSVGGIDFSGGFGQYLLRQYFPCTLLFSSLELIPAADAAAADWFSS